MKLQFELDIPEFKPWQKNHLEFGSAALKSTGVYIHGTPTQSQMMSTVDPLDSNVVYIGVATYRFRTRFDKFYGTLKNGFDHTLGSYNHTGAREALKEGFTADDFATSLCIISDDTMALMLERLLILLYKQKHGHVPRFNDTKPIR